VALVILDTETTGQPKDKDRICQIALLTDMSGEWELYNDYCFPSVEILSDAMAVHHITNEMVADKPSLKKTETYQILNALNRPENTIIIQNAPFDLGVLYNEGFTWNGAVLDTLVCAKHLLSTRRHALQFLRYELGLYRHEEALKKALGIDVRAHDAAGDVLVTKLLLNHLLEHVGGEVAHLVDLSDQPALVKTISFGKYKGQEYEHIVGSDPEYFRWVLGNFERLDRDARRTIEYWMTKIT